MVIEVELPSGYQPKQDTLNEMTQTVFFFERGTPATIIQTLVKLVEYNEETNSVAMYFDEMPKNDMCVNFQIEQILPVESTQPSIAEIYDYYDQTDVFNVEYTYW